MSSERLVDLRCRLRNVNAALAARRAEIRRTTASEKGKQRRRADAWGLGSVVLQTALIVYATAGYVAEPAVVFLRNSGRKRHWPPMEDGELASLVEECFLQTDVATLTALTDPDKPSNAAAYSAATKYVEEWRLVTWTADLNRSQGVAPPTSAVLQRREEMVRPDAGERDTALRLTAASASARVWAHRWRRRWGGRHARIRARDDVPTAELRDKAPQ